MGKVKNSVLDLVGNTPIVELSRYSEAANIKGVRLLGKLE